MNAFYKSFLRDGLGWLRGGGPRVHLAAFGKHPGWDDHMDDLGLDTHSLISLKRILYLEGIASNLATGAWDQLDESARLPGFNHLFRWQRGDQFLLGRIWSSRDGKGRAHFPMILCAHILGPPAPTTEQIAHILETLHQQCASTAKADEVRQLLAQARSELRQVAMSNERFNNLADALELGDLPELACFQPGEFHPRSNPPGKVARISAVTGNPENGLESWLSALRQRFDEEVPILVLAPLAANFGWIDVIVGEPPADVFFCLRDARPPTERQ